MTGKYLSGHGLSYNQMQGEADRCPRPIGLDTHLHADIRFKKIIDEERSKPSSLTINAYM